ncbi:HAMP domain-containing sensor histidine kinase [Polyangium sp. 6x1]|uniref:sensor histidine kinase n=1 Tax=Polyangium sp. 6x1 TaxID=3042689 RepID=UPI0024822731|nr:HAMP domain-containing sensor histidine kinase [Polyangium sp. 6x1]MDI1447103.1 HAMP domain-containing sensor histidine kinase [Polyangium sp. 6x1]
MKLKNRLSLAVTVVSAATLLTSFLTVYVLVRRDETRDLDLALVAQAHALAQIADAKNPGRPVVLDGVAEVPESLRPTQRYIAVYDERGALLSATTNFGSEVPTFETLEASTGLPTDGVPVDLDVSGKALRGVTVPVGDGGAALLYAASRRTVDEDASFLHRTLGVLFLSATIATALFSRWLGGRLAVDVHAIARVAREVERGNLEARVGESARGSTETRALAADLDHMIEHLGALVAAQRLFVSHAAHELRSPLSTLRGELQLALRRPRDAAGYQRTIEEALVDVEALSRLSEDLLTLARVQAPRSQGAEVVAIGDIVAEALRLARGPAEARRVSLEQASGNTSATPLLVRGDRSEIVRALRNLVDNAVAHGPAEAPVLTTTTRRDASVEIAVIDRGPGVAKEDEPHIFEPFYRGTRDRGDDRPGAGLGLAIARGIARNLGGDVWLDRSHEGGARFVLSLPALSDAEA